MLRVLDTLAKTGLIMIICGAVLLNSHTDILSLQEAGAAEPENASAVQEDENKAAEELENKTAEELQKFLLSDSESFEYKHEGRPDPFVPFLTEAIVKAESKSTEKELTGMRKFEPGQLTLVAITSTENGPLAMVQDSVGKGYILRKGTKIGRSGEVADIMPNVVIIKELTYT